MQAAINAVIDELRRLKAGGEKNIVVSAESVAALRKVIDARKPRNPGQQKPDFPGTDGSPGSAAPASATTPRVYSTLRQPAERAPRPPPEPKLAPPPTITLPEGDKKTRSDALLQLVIDDPECRKHLRPGKKAVLGVGNLDAKIFFCGEAPGAEEEIQGEPFVGPAGQLLTKMIAGMGLKREDVYIGNIMNWRPELPAAPGSAQVGNRPPTEEEMRYCLPYLRAQLEIIAPQLIVALGATAAKGLLGFDNVKTLGSVRSKWHDFSGIPLMVTYHPSYILHSTQNRLREAKRAVWEDLLRVMEKAGLPISDKQRGYFLR